MYPKHQKVGQVYVLVETWQNTLLYGEVSSVKNTTINTWLNGGVY